MDLEFTLFKNFLKKEDIFKIEWLINKGMWQCDFIYMHQNIVNTKDELSIQLQEYLHYVNELIFGKMPFHIREYLM